MNEQTAARRMRMLEDLAEGAERDLAWFAQAFEVDERTIRRDVDFLQELLATVHGVSLRRGRVTAERDEAGAGYFGDQMAQNVAAKQAIARRVVEDLGDDLAVALTAGSTTYRVAREIRRAHVEAGRPRNLIVFTNSLPALNELITAGVDTGVLGEVYNGDDRAFHSHEFQSAFQPGVAIVGASGAAVDAQGGALELYSQRAEEAAFLRQLLARAPEIVLAVDGSKLGKRHPWSFGGAGVLQGKAVRLYTALLSSEQRQALEGLKSTAPSSGWSFCYEESL